jgi:hypothetical protein
MSETISELGKILTGDHGRDAVHIAVAPVVAMERLRPGEHVGLVSVDGADGSEPYRVGRSKQPIGIVDPYLREEVDPGEACWLFLYPQTITSLRHQWVHPAFPGEAALTPEADSRKWIEGFAAELDQTYNRLMSAAALWVEDQDYTYDNTEAYKDVDYAKWPTFWHHYEIVTGTKVKDHTATFFACSC